MLQSAPTTAPATAPAVAGQRRSVGPGFVLGAVLASALLASGGTYIAINEARETDRPILLWAMNGHPLACT